MSTDDPLPGTDINSAESIRVLYVDDEPDFLEIVKVILERKKDLSIDTTHSGDEAIRLLKTRRYDLILSDYRMTRMDGMEFLRQVREIDPHIPFILFSGRVQDEMIIDAFGRGIASYIRKEGDPAVQFEELEARIREAVSLSRAVPDQG